MTSEQFFLFPVVAIWIVGTATLLSWLFAITMTCIRWGLAVRVSVTPKPGKGEGGELSGI